MLLCMDGMSMIDMVVVVVVGSTLRAHHCAASARFGSRVGIFSGACFLSLLPYKF